MKQLKDLVTKRSECPEDIISPTGNVYLKATNVLPLISQLVELVERQHRCALEVFEFLEDVETPKPYSIVNKCDDALTAYDSLLKALSPPTREGE